MKYDVSVVIITYNRSELLKGAVESVLAQEAEGVRYEVIVVDNNSSDTTRQVVEAHINRGRSNLRYLFEPQQGVSHARNAGLTAARSPVVAFADDDVRVAKDWVANIKRAFDLHPEVEFLGGKILPKWNTTPPSWLTREHWWALALLDRGDKPFYVNADNPLCLPTANASFRREVFARLGLFSPDFSGREDHEFLLRLWRTGCRGLYDPTIVVTADVQPERLTRDYHRGWNITTGKFNSLMRLNEIMGPDGRIVGEASGEVSLFGVPAFIYRHLFANCIGWLGATLRGHKARSLLCENYIWYSIGYITKRYERHKRQRSHSSLAEVAWFIRSFLRKKLNRSSRESEVTADQNDREPEPPEIGAVHLRNVVGSEQEG
jgi:glycosyltransferase involved in cell wall biosynthesis